MTSPFPHATLGYAAGRITFQGETRLTMPFAGALIVPRPGGETPPATDLAAAASPFAPLRFPLAEPGSARRFPQLRTMDGSVLGLADPVIVLVAEDPGVFAEFDLGNIFSQGKVLIRAPGNRLAPGRIP